MLGSGLGSTWFRIGPNYESGLGTTWFLLGSSLCEPHQSWFRLGGVEEMLGSGLGSTWFRLGSCAHGWQSLPEAQVRSLAA